MSVGVMEDYKVDQQMIYTFSIYTNFLSHPRSC